MTSSANRNVILFNTTVQKPCESLLAVVLQSEETTPEADWMINRTLTEELLSPKKRNTGYAINQKG